jgi:hypothetical protein
MLISCSPCSASKVDPGPCATRGQHSEAESVREAATELRRVKGSAAEWCGGGEALGAAF